MIREERLAELLQTNSTIYTIYGGYVSRIGLEFGSDRIEKNHLVELSVNKWGNTHTRYTFNMLFEDKSEAEEYLKYGTAIRIEKFPYVSWEEFQKQDNIFRFIDKQGNKCKVEGYFSEITGGFIDVVQGGTGLCHSLKYNKKDYLTALDIAVKLFKGEE